MPDDETLKRIEARLTRLEAVLSQQPAGPAASLGAMVDPVPFPGGGWGGGWGGPWTPGRPHPIVDPAAYAPAYRYHSPAIVDYAPWPWGPNVDPAAYAGVPQQTAATAFFRRPPVGDPAPIDINSFTVDQLEATLHSINAEKARLNSMETMIRQRLEKKQREG
jgi:hypothetical protein